MLATVVWRRAPSSGKQGAKALISADGTVTGWLGGACAEPAVAREALRALADGAPRLMYLGPAEELEGARREGVVDGADRVPERRRARGVPRAGAAATAARGDRAVAGRRRAGGDGGRARLAGRAGRRASASSTDGGRPRSARLLVRRGRDPGPLRRRRPWSSRSPRPRHTWDSSPRAGGRRRCSTTLRARGVSDEALARVRAPAGLDLGATEPAEIAVAILAEIVQLRAAGRCVPPECRRRLHPRRRSTRSAGWPSRSRRAATRSPGTAARTTSARRRCRERFVSSEATAER